MSGSASVPSSTEAAVSLLTGLHYVGALALFGIVLLEIVVVRDARWRALPALVLGAGLLTLTSALLQVPVLAMRSMMMPLTEFGHRGAWLPLVLPSMVAFVAVTVMGVVAAVALRRVTKWTSVARVLGSGGAAVAPVLIGHSAAMSPLPLVVDGLHLLVAGAWVGGVISLTALFVRPAGLDAAGAARALVRFSGIASISVIVLIATGVTLAFVRMPTAAALLESPAGRVLLIKSLLVAAVLSVAGYNRNHLVPAVCANAEDRHAWRVLRRTAAFEGVLLVGIAVVTGMLTTTTTTTMGGMSH